MDWLPSITKLRHIPCEIYLHKVLNNIESNFPQVSAKKFNYINRPFVTAFGAYLSDFGSNFRHEIARLWAKIAYICYNMVLESYYRDFCKNRFLFNEGVKYITCPLWGVYLWRVLLLTRMIPCRNLFNRIEIMSKVS